jgi:hypothetical protein
VVVLEWGDHLSMHISGRGSIGLIVSAAWITGTVIWLTFADMRIARFLRYSAFEVCDYINYHMCHCGNCWRDLIKAAEFVDHPLINLALISLMPIVLVWLGASVTLRVWHWGRPS